MNIQLTNIQRDELIVNAVDQIVEDMDIDALQQFVKETLAEGYSQCGDLELLDTCLLYTSPSPRDQRGSRMPSSA